MRLYSGSANYHHWERLGKGYMGCIISQTVCESTKTSRKISIKKVNSEAQMYMVQEKKSVCMCVCVCLSVCLSACLYTDSRGGKIRGKMIKQMGQIFTISDSV